MPSTGEVAAGAEMLERGLACTGVAMGADESGAKEVAMVCC